MRHTMRTTAIAALAALAVAACGGGSGGSSGGGSGGGPTTLNVQENAGVPSAFDAFGISKGFFKKHGLDVKLQTSQGGAAQWSPRAARSAT